MREGPFVISCFSSTGARHVVAGSGYGLTVALHLHRAQRTDTLADELGELLASPLPDPFAQEVVVVPEQGIERWLAQRLSHRLGTGEGSHDGVCAGVTFLRPRSLVTMLTGRDDDDPWLPQHLVWPLLEVIDAGLGQPWCAALSRHLGHGTDDPDGTRAGRRYSVALRLARLFHRYGQSRPTMLADWREGRDTDGTGGPLDHDLVWQAELWRRLVGVVDAPPPDVRHAETVAALRDGRGATSSGTGGVTGGGLELPERLSLFGHTRLAVTEVELLHALAGSRDVHLWLPQPSPDLWERLTPFAAEGVVARDDDATSDLVRHPLLASLGRDSRELVRVLGATSGSRGGAPAPSRGAGSDHGPSSGGRSGGAVGARVAAGRSARRPRPRRERAHRPDRADRRPLDPGPRVPRARPAGRGAARGARRAARRRPHPRAARRARHVPRRRDLCAAHRRGLRPRRARH
ncbi:exodeoxyribonuclease V subunit gamma [Janibacter hoylei PVAS-1]|uniref:Exodeoxyribonuclease V subunit gamma n=1 Tax=Janibacter hoylei PVAS-1 TaxID=1210046 RepID=K1E1R3_9MICO|nr:exodeoxyribonuclease V subunit gamma [Janibacter hoylei PVAS-1]